MKKFMWMCLSLSLWVFSALASDDFTKGVLLSTVPINSSSLSTAQLSELSSAAIEKGLKDTQLLAKPSWDAKHRVMTLNWHSITKTVNGTEHSKALTEPLTTQLKLPKGVEQITVGQEITLKGDLDSMLEDFDRLLADAEQATEIDSEKNVDASTTNEADDFGGSTSSSGGGSGSGYLSEGGLSENQALDDLEVKVDKITSTAEQCTMNVDWSTMSVFKQERIIKTSTETGEIVERGECFNVGQANKIEKDFASTCSIQINGLEDYSAGYIYYTFIDGDRVDLSGCRYEAETAKKLNISNDFGACSLELAEVNSAKNVYYPAAVKYTLIDGTRYNLTECETIPESETPLPTKIESCEILHTVSEETSYKMQRVDIYDPANKNRLKTGDCEKAQSYPMLKDYEASCTIKFNDNSYVKGFKYYVNIDNERHDISACTYQDSDTTDLEIVKDFERCNISDSKINIEAGTYNRPFVKYSLIDGQRYDLSGCVTSEDIVDTLPTQVATCEIKHSIPDMKSYRMERVDTYDPNNKNIVKEGECYSIEEITIQRDFDAGCKIQINENDTFLRGFKYFSTVDGSKYELSACEYNESDAQSVDVFKDFDSCGSDNAILDIENGIYQPAFIRYTLIDSNRYDLSPCTNSVDETAPLPTRTETCALEHSNENLKSYSKERVDTYDPDNKSVVKEGECYITKEIDYQRDYKESCSIRFNDDLTHQRGFELFSIVEGKRFTHTGCQYDDNEKLATNELKDFDKCSLDKALINLELGYYNPAYSRYALVDGKRYELSECGTSIDIQTALPTRKEVCELEHSIPDMKTYRMERIDTYDPQDKDLLKEGDCYSIEEFAIQKDFDAGCAIQVNPTFSNFTRGYKYFSSVDGSKYILSECEYDSSSSEAYEVFKDYSKCSIDLAVTNLSSATYQVPFSEYTLIDGVRYELSGCRTSEEDVKPLPTRLEQCDYTYDFDSEKAYQMERKDILDPSAKTVLKEGDCYSVGEFAINRDYGLTYCSNLPDYINSNLALGFRHFITVDGEKQYVSECGFDLENKIPMLQAVENCSANENLSTNTATLYKKWYYVLDDGKREYVTNCEPSDETYDIVVTENTCSPVFIEESRKVVIQNRKGWIDSNGDWHYVTDCSPTSDDVSLLTEVCSPKYDHDYSGNQSYLLTRDYYTHNGVNVYISSCTRNPDQSFPHFKDATGCSVKHDDPNLRSQVVAKTMVELDEGVTQLKGCEDQEQFVPYQFTGSQIKGVYKKSSVVGYRDVAASTNPPSAPSMHLGTIATACNEVPITDSLGKYSYQYLNGQSRSTTPTVFYSGYSQIGTTPPAHCSDNSSCNPVPVYRHTWSVQGKMDVEVIDWKRADTSQYREYRRYICFK